MEFILSYAVFAVVFGLVDAIWLVKVSKQFYQKEIGSLLAKKPDMTAAVVFYALYVLGVTVFVLQPAMTDEYWPVLAMGALFGAVAYATYDLTNQATLKHWSKKVTVVDIAWGAFATGLAAVITALLTNWILG